MQLSQQLKWASRTNKPNFFFSDLEFLTAKILWKLSGCAKRLKNWSKANPTANQNNDGSKAEGIFSKVKLIGKKKIVKIIGNIKTPWKISVLIEVLKPPNHKYIQTIPVVTKRDINFPEPSRVEKRLVFTNICNIKNKNKDIDNIIFTNFFEERPYLIPK